MSHEERETKITLYQLLGITKERADEISRMVRASFSESSGPTEWIVRLAEEFQIDRQELAEARGFNLVLPTSGLLLFSPSIDLTSETLARLDEKLPNVKVPEKAD